MTLMFDVKGKFPSLPIYQLLGNAIGIMGLSNKPSGSIKKKLWEKTRKKINKEKALNLKFRTSDLPEEEKDRLLFEVFDILLYENKKEGN